MDDPFRFLILALTRLLRERTSLAHAPSLIEEEESLWLDQNLGQLGGLFLARPLAVWPEMSVLEKIDFHTLGQVKPFLDFFAIQLMESFSASPTKTTALIYLLRLWERTTLARDMATLLARAPSGAESLGASERLHRLLEEKVNLERFFFGLADERQKQMAALKLEEITLEKALREASIEQRPGLLNERVQNLEASARKLLEQMVLEAERETQEAFYPQGLDSDVENAFESIAALPLFRGMGKSALRSLLQGARIQTVKRGEAFLTQGEQVSRFFILLDGWAKLYKSTEEGEEAVLHFLGKKEALLDASLISNALCAVGGKALSPVTLLSLSAPLMREHLAQNKTLAVNMMNASLLRLHKLLGQFEQITLHDATERVGWFFLNLYLETGLPTTPLVLPFDKALIASYLNLKPETFSRVLKTFRDKGFVIDRHQIVMPGPRALCVFCDTEALSRCCHAGADDCMPGPRSCALNAKKRLA